MSETSNEHVQGDSGPGVLDRVTDLFEKWATEENLHRVEGEFGIAEGLNIAINDLRSAVHGAPECPICGSTKPGGAPSCDCEAHRDVPTTEVTQPDPDGGVEMTDGEWATFRGLPQTPDRLAEIEARLAAATLLPWMKDPDDPDKVLHSTNGGFDGTVIATVQRDDYGLFEEANTDLIAHAPADLAALVAVVKAVREIHRPSSGYDGIAGEEYETCAHCLETANAPDETPWDYRYPCPTVRALEAM